MYMKAFRFLRRSLVWVYRFRHRCGYGIHSPFAFHIVRDVIYEEDAFYAYSPLAAEPAADSGLRLKDLRLLLRLANDHRPRTGILLGKDTRGALRYLQAGRNSCRFLGTEARALPEKSAELPERLDLCYADRPEEWELAAGQLLPRCHGGTLVIMRGIHRGKSARRTWQTLQALTQVRVTFDLYDFGLAYFEERLNKQDYVINYF